MLHFLLSEMTTQKLICFLQAPDLFWCSSGILVLSRHRSYNRVMKEFHFRLLGFTKFIGNWVSSCKSSSLSLAPIISMRPNENFSLYLLDTIQKCNFGNLKIYLFPAPYINTLIIFISTVLKVPRQVKISWVDSTQLDTLGPCIPLKVNARWVEHMTKSKW